MLRPRPQIGGWGQEQQQNFFWGGLPGDSRKQAQQNITQRGEHYPTKGYIPDFRRLKTYPPGYYPPGVNTSTFTQILPTSRTDYNNCFDNPYEFRGPQDGTCIAPDTTHYGGIQNYHPLNPFDSQHLHVPNIGFVSDYDTGFPPLSRNMGLDPTQHNPNMGPIFTNTWDNNLASRTRPINLRDRTQGPLGSPWRGQADFLLYKIHQLRYHRTNWLRVPKALHTKILQFAGSLGHDLHPPNKDENFAQNINQLGSKFSNTLIELFQDHLGGQIDWYVTRLKKLVIKNWLAELASANEKIKKFLPHCKTKYLWQQLEKDLDQKITYDLQGGTTLSTIPPNSPTYSMENGIITNNHRPITTLTTDFLTNPNLEPPTNPPLLGDSNKPLISFTSIKSNPLHSETMTIANVTNTPSKKRIRDTRETSLKELHSVINPLIKSPLGIPTKNRFQPLTMDPDVEDDEVFEDHMVKDSIVTPDPKKTKKTKLNNTPLIQTHVDLKRGSDTTEVTIAIESPMRTEDVSLNPGSLSTTPHKNPDNESDDGYRFLSAISSSTGSASSITLADIGLKVTVPLVNSLHWTPNPKTDSTKVKENLTKINVPTSSPTIPFPKVWEQIHVHRYAKENWNIEIVHPLTEILLIGDSNVGGMRHLPHNWEVHCFPGARLQHASKILTTLKHPKSLELVIVAMGINNRDDPDILVEKTVCQVKEVLNKGTYQYFFLEVAFNLGLTKKQKDTIVHINRCFRTGTLKEGDTKPDNIDRFIPINFIPNIDPLDRFGIHHDQLSLDNILGTMIDFLV